VLFERGSAIRDCFYIVPPAIKRWRADRREISPAKTAAESAGEVGEVAAAVAAAMTQQPPTPEATTNPNASSNNAQEMEQVLLALPGIRGWQSSN